ncbi:MAG: hypothetical protein RMN25_09985 [Anaerolineae bacterium]|nr:hypothetical protein [Thermoflexales bacterium]MDW8408098.1 hypothetical protein [Anaerolineae bacterium]
MIQLPTRQVHLDFHTSELIPDIGKDFDKAQWQAALRAGHINSITVFAKCHHSWSYYPTRIGQPHPHLQRNLLKEQIDAAHEIGVRAPIYYTVGWSAADAEHHPEWVARNKDGSISCFNYDVHAAPSDPKPIISWKNLCPSGAYKELILAQTREICELFEVDGFFYDICFREPCYCPNCLAGMRAEGLDPDNDVDAARYNTLKWQRLTAECNAIVHAAWPQATVFYNGSASQYHSEWHIGDTHFELEDLPTTWGGYDKFPIRARYFANTGKSYLAMSGKFHTNWGEFGGFKDREAIKFEAACMIAYGARCSFGDQLHPNGVMDKATYENIGHAYAYVEQIEEYGLDGRPCANLGLFLSGSEPDDQGVANMLMENQIDFELVMPGADVARFDALVLPGAAFLDDATAARVSAFARAGGAVLVLGESGLTRDRAANRATFALNVGAEYVGPSAYRIDYLVVSAALSADLPASPFLNYTAAFKARLVDAELLAAIHEPYFDRTYAQYCSHQNTPYRAEPAAHPGAWRTGNLVYLPHRLGEMYYHHGAKVHRQLFLNALRLIYTRRTVETRLPSAGRVALTHQPDRRRYVAHLMYAPPLQRGRCLVIEDMPPLYDVAVRLNVPQVISRAYLAPDKTELPLVDGAQAVVPQVIGHQAVVFEYE